MWDFESHCMCLCTLIFIAMLDSIMQISHNLSVLLLLNIWVVSSLGLWISVCMYLGAQKIHLCDLYTWEWYCRVLRSRHMFTCKNLQHGSSSSVYFHSHEKCMSFSCSIWVCSGISFSFNLHSLITNDIDYLFVYLFRYLLFWNFHVCVILFQKSTRPYNYYCCYMQSIFIYIYWYIYHFVLLSLLHL